jgi:acetoacetate decarboxylase
VHFFERLIIRYSTDVETLADEYVHVDSVDINEPNAYEFIQAATGTGLEFEGLRWCDICRVSF